MLLRRLSLAFLLVFGAPAAPAQESDPPVVTIGERLFLETRFSQFFFAQAKGNANAVLPAGDAVMDSTLTTTGTLTGPFAGQAMNCRACHLVDEHQGDGGNRAYSDFARRSPIPRRPDGATASPRNSPTMVSARRPTNGHVLLHLDGEFATGADLIQATLTGRNFGWLPSEQAQALHHVAQMIRSDDGRGALAQEFGGLPYRVLLKGTVAVIPPELRLPAALRFDPIAATDAQVVAGVARVLNGYMQSLRFSRDEAGRFNASPYDVFLRKNDLPVYPAVVKGVRESDVAYSRRLLARVLGLQNPQFVTPADGSFTTHAQSFAFGAAELQGLITFLTEPPVGAPQPLSGVGNCIACHSAPSFSDFTFHNTGATQLEYDAIFGAGAFAQLRIPGIAERQAHPNAWLPATPQHPYASTIYRSVPAVEAPGRTDLGLWNVFGNPDMPRPQARLRQLLYVPFGDNSPGAQLARAVARFRTPSLRDLGQTNPYLHNGSKDTLEDVLEFYRESAEITRSGKMRNGEKQIGRVGLGTADIAPVAAFLRALNEDYN